MNTVLYATAKFICWQISLTHWHAGQKGHCTQQKKGVKCHCFANNEALLTAYLGVKVNFT